MPGEAATTGRMWSRVPFYMYFYMHVCVYVWCNHGISTAIKVAGYRMPAAILSCLLYGCEGWTRYRHHIQKLDQFHLQCLRKIAHIRWQQHVPNTTVLRICNISGLEALLSSDGVDMSLVWMIHGFLSMSFMDNSIMAFGVLVGSTSDTKTV